MQCHSNLKGLIDESENETIEYILFYIIIIVDDMRLFIFKSLVILFVSPGYSWITIWSCSFFVVVVLVSFIVARAYQPQLPLWHSPISFFVDQETLFFFLKAMSAENNTTAVATPSSIEIFERLMRPYPVGKQASLLFYSQIPLSRPRTSPMAKSPSIRLPSMAKRSKESWESEIWWIWALKRTLLKESLTTLRKKTR